MVVRIAIAMFEGEVSPRFCFAKSAALYDWDGQRPAFVCHADLGETPYPERLEILARQGARVLLCGSFPVVHVGTAEALGLRVVCGLAGAMDDVTRKLKPIMQSAANKWRCGELCCLSRASPRPARS